VAERLEEDVDGARAEDGERPGRRDDRLEELRPGPRQEERDSERGQRARRPAAGALAREDEGGADEGDGPPLERHRQEGHGDVEPRRDEHPLERREGVVEVEGDHEPDGAGLASRMSYAGVTTFAGLRAVFETAPPRARQDAGESRGCAP
jgi:hypothetical protein